MNKKLPPLWLCVLLDLVGMLSYFIPGIGEWTDAAWAPISAVLFNILFGGVKGTAIVFLEEALPYADIIPTFTITYFIRKKQQIRTDNNNLTAKRSDNAVV